MEKISALIVFLPGLVAATLGLGWLLGWKPGERTVARMTSSCYLLAGVAVVALLGWMLQTGQHEVRLSLGYWFELEEYRFPLVLLIDRLSMPLVALSVLLVGVIGAFSVSYVHRDEGFLRFFVLLNLFGFGILLLFTAGSFDLMIAGWELVGLTSVLLIGFFQFRNDPVRSALRVFLTYRICDIGLLTGVAMLHHFAGTGSFDQLFTGPWPNGISLLTGTGAMIVGALFLLAAMGKAAQVPFSGWLPRAMEGPTPSSAIFYGALSVHAGAYLLLRAQPLIASSLVVSAAVVTIGIVTAIHGTMVGRACADAKTAIGYAAMSQLGIIFVEIGLGLKWIALTHITGHAVVRTLQFLRAPSMLHDHHRLHAAAGGHLGETGAHFEMLLPASLRVWLYRLAIERGHHDTMLDRCIVAPVIRLAGQMEMIEERLANSIIGPARPEHERLAIRNGLRSIGKSGRVALGHKLENADV